jgi:hypothetical protein
VADTGGGARPIDDGAIASLGLQMNESRRLLELQERSLEALKGRAGVLLGSASVVTGLVAGLTDSQGCFDRAMVIAAIAAYVVVVGLCVDVLRPHPWRFTHTMKAFEDCDIAGRYPKQADVAVHFIRTFQGCRRSNASRLKRLQSEYFAGCVILGVQVVAWAAAAL